MFIVELEGVGFPKLKYLHRRLRVADSKANLLNGTQTRTHINISNPDRKFASTYHSINTG